MAVFYEETLYLLCLIDSRKKDIFPVRKIFSVKFSGYPVFSRFPTHLKEACSCFFYLAPAEEERKKMHPENGPTVAA